MDSDSEHTIEDWEDWIEGSNECWLMSQAALAVDWDRPEEDAAWAYLSTSDGTEASESTVQP